MVNFAAIIASESSLTNAQKLRVLDSFCGSFGFDTSQSLAIKQAFFNQKLTAYIKRTVTAYETTVEETNIVQEVESIPL